MAERLQIIVDLDVKGTNDITKLKQELGGLGDAGKQASPGLSNAASGTSMLSGAIGKLAAGGLLLAAGQQLLAFGKASISAASDVQEMQSKFNTVFKDLGGSVTAELQSFADAANRSVYDLQGFAATLQDTFVPLGFARDEAANMSVQIVKLAEDLASFNNLDTADVVADLQSALVGNTETLRKYGVVANQAAIDQKALEMGLTFTKGAMDAQTKAAAILALTMEGTTDAQGDAIRTSDSYANQVKGLEAAMTDLKVTVGNALLPVMTDLVGIATEAAQMLRTAAGAAGEYGDQATEIINSNIESAASFEDLVAEAQKMDRIRGFGTAITGTTGAIRDGFASITPELVRASGSFEEFQSAMNSLSRVSQQDMKNFIFSQGLTIEQFYEQEKAAMAAEEGLRQMAVAASSADDILLRVVDTTAYFAEATAGADAVLLQTVDTYQTSAAAAQLLAEKQAAAAATADVLTAASERDAEQLSRMAESGYLAANGITAIIPAADSVTASVSRASREMEKLNAQMAAMDGRTVSATVRVNTINLAEDLGGGDAAGGKGNQGKGGINSGDSYSGSAVNDPSAPKYASGTDGWQTVPGSMGQPYPVILHGGEEFNVIPNGGGTTNNTNSSSSSTNIVQNFYGPTDPARAGDSVKNVLNSQGIQGFA